MKNIRIFYLEFFPFLVVKFSIYLNRRVFVMIKRKSKHTKIQTKERQSNKFPLLQQEDHNVTQDLGGGGGG